MKSNILNEALEREKQTKSEKLDGKERKGLKYHEGNHTQKNDLDMICFLDVCSLSSNFFRDLLVAGLVIKIILAHWLVIIAIMVSHHCCQRPVKNPGLNYDYN